MSGVRCVRSKYVRYLYITILFTLHLQLTAQFDDSLYLESVVVVVSEIKQTNVLDSSLILNEEKSITEILQENSSIQIQDYGGKGAVQSVLIRGLTSNHTKVKWNGLQINSLTLGMFDFGGISGFGNNYLKLSKGANIENDGDGAIGGSINFGSRVKYNKGFKTKYCLTAGSFGTYLLGVSSGVSKKKWVYNLSFSKEAVENNFNYENHKRIGRPTIMQSNSEFRSTNVMQQFGVRFKKFELSSLTWLNGKRKNIPMLLTESQSVKKYTADSSFRTVLIANSKIKYVNISGLIGRDKQWFKYRNPGLVFTYYVVTNDQTEISSKGNLKNFIWSAKSNLQIQKATNTNYLGVKKRILSLSTISSKYYFEGIKTKIKATAGFQKSSDLNKVYPSTTLGYKKDFKKMVFTGGVGSHFRQPTFNDLFWKAGGNGDLESENGWSIEQFMKFERQKGFSFNIGAYYSIIDNWIQWVPSGTIWMPQNVKKVKASGVESLLEMKFNVNKFKVNLSNSSSYTRTTVIESEIINDNAIGNQAVNIPFFNSLLKSGFSNNKWRLNYRVSFKGKRYISFDNNEDSALPSYWLSSLDVSRNFVLKDLNIASKIRIANLFNQAYEVVGNVPMPGRAFYLTLNFKFKNN